MDKQEILEGNKIIAEFLGIPKCGRCEDCGGYQYSPAVIFLPSEMMYSENWDWIMPVVIKIISELRTDFYIDRMNYDNFFVGLGTDGTYSQNERNDSAIDGVFKSVIGFIKWYNGQKTSADVVITKK